METLETRLQKRIYVSLYALFFLITLLGLSVLLEGCTGNGKVKKEYTYCEQIPAAAGEIHASVDSGPGFFVRRAISF